MKFNWTQFGIAFGLFLLGYLTFNNPWFSGSKDKDAAAAAVQSAPALTSETPASSNSSPVLPSRR